MTVSSSGAVLMRGAPLSRREQSAIELVAQALPVAASYGLWANLVLFTPAGDDAEIDLLVLGHHALYLVEIEHWHGRLSGHGDTWSQTPPGSAPRAVDSPLRHLIALARQVRHALTLENPALARLRIEPLLFVPDDGIELDLPSSARERIVTPRDLMAVLQLGELPGTDHDPAWEPVDESTARSLVRVLDGLRRGRRPGHGSLAEEASRLQRGLAADFWQQALDPVAGHMLELEASEEVAAAWVVSCAFVRALEDRGLLDRPTLSPGQADTVARQRAARDELVARIDTAARQPACEPVLAAPQNPIWTILPSEQGARALLDFFWPPGGPRWSFARGAGDPWSALYQELSSFLRQTHAWVATPRFVGTLLLDLTLDPILGERGPDAVQVLDPACGSGTLLAEAFERLADARQQRAPDTDPIANALHVLDRICGIDISPAAALIARIRLVLAYLDRIGVRSIDEAPRPRIRVAVADALLMADEAADPEAAAILSSQYHIVISNPPYITCKDAARRNLYRQRYRSASRQFSLAAPFIERCFQLADPGGLVGMLTANSFMQREFGKPLIEDVLPRLDLTRILDTSGAYIPGHGTPTLILVGRNRLPRSSNVRVAGGKRGEPIAPVHPEKGRVWSALAAHHDEVGYEDEYIAVADVSRDVLARHPWNLSGSEPVPREQVVRRSLEQVVARVGMGGMSGLDEVFVMPPGMPERLGLEQAVMRPLIMGETVRDWAAEARMMALVPHGDEQGEPLPFDPKARWVRFLWRYRTVLQHQAASVPGRAQEEWWSWSSWPGRPAGPSLVGRMVSRSNELALNPGVALQRTVIVIELSSKSSNDDAFALLGYLNSSTACYWLKKVSPAKGSLRGATPPEQHVFEFSGSLRRLLMPRFVFASGEQLRTELIALARRLHEAALARAESAPEQVLARWAGGSRRDLMRALANAQQREVAISRQMVCDQEDLDWLVYAAIGLVPRPLRRAQGAARPEQRPFAWLSDEPPAGLDPRLVEVWAQRRHVLVRDPALRVLESAMYKRFFRDESRALALHGTDALAEAEDTEAEDSDGRAGPLRQRARGDHMEHRIAMASERWLLDRLEDALRAMSAPCCLSAAELASRLERMDGASAVISLSGERESRDRADTISSLLQANAVPFLAAMRHTDSGLAKHADWERTWTLQRRQDAGEPVEPPAPPRYSIEDYRDAITWRHRGKLDVPKERFIAYPNAGSDGKSWLYGWAGWDEEQRAAVLMALYDERRHRTGWAPERLCPLLAGILELAPWTAPRSDAGAGAEREVRDCEQFVAMEAQALGLSVDAIRAWRLRDRGTKKYRKVDRGRGKE